ncbi:MAG: UDP-N-acetylglucosamine--LPS N-acetylglucosamine transferase [Eggerthellaceae bacterium]|nr:UDP-N-acetylglucosamine--LPS N-acetylglucosamine transferase [Eggerthellaceae bacterium]
MTGSASEETGSPATATEEEQGLVLAGEDDVNIVLDEDPGPVKILIVHASVGSGHKSAAFGIASAFKILDEEGGFEGRAIVTEVLDILDFGRIVFDGDSTASMFTGATRPFYDLTWRYTLTGRLLWGGGTIWARVMFPKFVEYVAAEKPDAIICTHITGANVAVSARMILHATFPIVCVPTDYEAEGLWPHLHTDLFCVANEHMAETLRPRKVEEKRIRVTGIPAAPDFAREYDADQIRQDMGLPKDKQIALFLAGATLPRPYVHFRSALDELIPFMHRFHDMHFVIVAGKDADYADHMRRQVADHDLENVTVLDYVDGMAALMSASDLIVCKSGGLTTTECLCVNSPMVLMGRAYGQEKANVAMLTAAGAAYHVTTSRELQDLLLLIESHPHMTDAIKYNADLIRRPDAAMEIAKATLDLIRGIPKQDEKLLKKRFLHFYWGGKPAHIR